MCGRYSFAPKPKQIDAQLRDIQLPTELKISFNIAPTHRAHVIANDAPGKMQEMNWGLVPHWSADGKNSGKLINARAEGINEKPSFREPCTAVGVLYRPMVFTNGAPSRAVASCPTGFCCKTAI